MESRGTKPHKPVAAVIAFLALVTGCSGGDGGSDVGDPAPSAAESASDPAPSATESAGPGDTSLSLVVIGDSLPYAQQDCGGCPSFATLFGDEMTTLTEAPTTVKNLSTHDGATTADLLERVETDEALQEEISGADVVVISAGHNDTPWNVNDDSCDGPSGDDIDWSLFTSTCALDEAQAFGVALDGVLSQVAALRAGEPTAIRLITFYNDWIGGPGVPAEATDGSKLVLDAFSDVICDVAAAHDATCVDTYHAFNGEDGMQAAGPLLAGDYTHPSAKGHERIAELLSEAGLAPLS